MQPLESVHALARFAPAKMTKVTIHESGSLLLGLNCLEPGQSQAAHAHAASDKFYYVVSGRARFTVAGQTFEAAAGDVVLCAAGAPHGVEEALERTILLVGIAPGKA